VRSQVEHAFGLLKGHFLSLKDLCPTDDLRDTYHAVAAMMVIHNLCIDLNDNINNHSIFDGNDADVEEAVQIARYGTVEEGDEPGLLPGWETDANRRERGHARWKILLDLLFPL